MGKHRDDKKHRKDDDDDYDVDWPTQDLDRPVQTSKWFEDEK